MHKQAYDLGLRLALQESGLVKHAGFLRAPLILGGTGAILGAMTGASRPPPGQSRWESAARSAGVGAATGVGAGVGLRLVSPLVRAFMRSSGDLTPTPRALAILGITTGATGATIAGGTAGRHLGKELFHKKYDLSQESFS